MEVPYLVGRGRTRLSASFVMPIGGAHGYESRGLRGGEDIAPFVSKETLSELADREFAKNGLRYFENIAPHMDEAQLNALAKRAIEKDGIRAISPFAAFLDQEMLSAYVREKYL